jgi:hypothetical protein
MMHKMLAHKAWPEATKVTTLLLYCYLLIATIILMLFGQGTNETILINSSNKK